MIFSIYSNRSPHSREIEDSTESMTVQNIRHFQLDWKSFDCVVQKMLFNIYSNRSPHTREIEDSTESMTVVWLNNEKLIMKMDD
ncbi:hypothetical protein EC396_14665 [Lutibacter sp. HS1-25]|nr:hypothetical protein EC396_14665 [Lutibacter sp. HS1-25]